MDAGVPNLYDPEHVTTANPTRAQEDPVSEWTIRPGTLDELDDLIMLRRSLFEAMGYEDPEVLAQTDEACRTYFARQMPSGDFRVWVAEAGGDPIASIGLVVHSVPPSPGNLSGRVGYIMNLVTTPAFRRQGIARALMENALRTLHDEGVPIATLHATADGRPLYERLGFTADTHLPEMRRQAA